MARGRRPVGEARRSRLAEVGVNTGVLSSRSPMLGVRYRPMGPLMVQRYCNEMATLARLAKMERDGRRNRGSTRLHLWDMDKASSCRGLRHRGRLEGKPAWPPLWNYLSARHCEIVRGVWLLVALLPGPLRGARRGPGGDVRKKGRAGGSSSSRAIAPVLQGPRFVGERTRSPAHRFSTSATRHWQRRMRRRSGGERQWRDDGGGKSYRLSRPWTLVADCGQAG